MATPPIETARPARPEPPSEAEAVIDATPETDVFASGDVIWTSGGVAS